MEQLVKSLVDRVVNLDESSENPFLNELAEKVKEVTQPADQVAYRENKTLQKTGEIEKTIAPYFKKFIDAPWTEATNGYIANFKYYCEQGERPRFYNHDTEGVYGFRLRTRDHSWINGVLYVVPKSFPYESTSEDAPEIKSIGYHHEKVVARLGRLIMMFRENR